MKVTRKFCKTKRNKTQAERKACHRLLHNSSKLPKRKYRRYKARRRME